jgi:Tocopherol cyclase
MSAPRFPGVAAQHGHYESYYLRAADPASGRSAWIRHTVFKRPGGPATGALWCTLFDANEPEPRAVKESLPDPRAADWLALGPSHFGPTGASGRAEALGRSAAWELGFGPASEPLRHLPHPKLYDAPVPRTKVESPLPDTKISGWVEANGERWELDEWPGMVGHNWGAEHAERWIWLHGVGFDGAPDAWLDLALGRVRMGPLTTPWIANGALHLDGERIRLGGLGRRARVDEHPAGGTIEVSGVRIEVRAAPLVAWLYADPSGGEHHSTNGSIAAVELTRGGRTLRTDHGGAWELGTREAPPGVPVQPFPDP